MRCCSLECHSVLCDALICSVHISRSQASNLPRQETVQGGKKIYINFLLTCLSEIYDFGVRVFGRWLESLLRGESATAAAAATGDIKGRGLAQAQGGNLGHRLDCLTTVKLMTR